MNLRNTILLTHKFCMDGTGCAILFIAAGGKRENVFFSSPDHGVVEDSIAKIRKLHPGKDIILADLSVTEDLAIRLVKDGVNILIFDHHQSAAGLKEQYFCEIDNDRCGCKILYDYFAKQGCDLKRYDDLIIMIDDSDRWQHKYPQSKAIGNLFYLLGTQLIMDRFLDNPDIILSDKETYLVEIEQYKSKEFIADKIREARLITKTIGDHDYKIAVVEAGNNQSQLGHDLCEQLGADFAMMINGKSVSLRSNSDDVDLSILAALNKGGGHKKSSGIGLKSILGKDLIDVVLDKFKWD